MRKEVARAARLEAAGHDGGGDVGGAAASGTLQGMLGLAGLGSSIESIGDVDLNSSSRHHAPLSPQGQQFAAVGVAIAKAAAAGTLPKAALQGLERSGIDLNASIASLNSGRGAGSDGGGSEAVEPAGLLGPGSYLSPTGGSKGHPLPVTDPAAEGANSLSVTDWGAMTLSLNQQQQQQESSGNSGSGGSSGGGTTHRMSDVGLSPASVLRSLGGDQNAGGGGKKNTRDDNDGAPPKPLTSASPARKPTHSAISSWRNRRKAGSGAASGTGTAVGDEKKATTSTKNNAKSALDDYIQKNS